MAEMRSYWTPTLKSVHEELLSRGLDSWVCFVWQFPASQKFVSGTRNFPVHFLEP